MALTSRLATRLQATRMLARSASTAVPAAAPQNLPPVSEAEDPQLAGLAYPKVPEVNRQLRPAKTGWWDEQDRWNQSEAVGLALARVNHIILAFAHCVLAFLALFACLFWTCAGRRKRRCAFGMGPRPVP